MNISSARDKNNPHWISLLRHVKQLNDKLIAIANFYLGDHVMARITDDSLLPKATRNIADACLEVTDATCVVMATMRSVVHKYKIDNNKAGKKVDIANFELKQTTPCPTESINGYILIPAKEMNGVLSFLEIAIILSQKNKKGELEFLLLHTVSEIKKLLELQQLSDNKSIQRENTDIHNKRRRCNGPG